ncbi:MAG: nucleotidyltransferase family protein [Terriglobales bacterium]
MGRPAKIGLTRAQIKVIAKWAKKNSYLTDLRVFGSRAKGCARKDSDLDIAITADDDHYFNLAAKWEAELSELTGLRAVVRRYTVEPVRQYCDDFSIVLFDRAAKIPSPRRSKLHP